MSDFAINAALDASTLQRRERARHTVSRDGMSAAERRIRAALKADPALTKDAIARIAVVSGSTASKYLRLIDQERAAAAQSVPLALPPPLAAPMRQSAPWLPVAVVGALVAVAWWARGRSAR